MSFITHGFSLFCLEHETKPLASEMVRCVTIVLRQDAFGAASQLVIEKVYSFGSNIQNRAFDVQAQTGRHA